jgi:hypothetical protein
MAVIVIAMIIFFSRFFYVGYLDLVEWSLAKGSDMAGITSDFLLIWYQLKLQAFAQSSVGSKVVGGAFLLFAILAVSRNFRSDPNEAESAEGDEEARRDEERQAEPEAQPPLIAMPAQENITIPKQESVAMPKQENIAMPAQENAQERVAAPTKYCGKCGAPYNVGKTKFCGKCGNPFRQLAISQSESQE